MTDAIKIFSPKVGARIARFGLVGDSVAREPKSDYVLVWSSEYYGDHADNWVLEIDMADSREVRRFNAQHVAWIEWLEVADAEK